MNTASSNIHFLRFAKFKDFSLWDYKTHFGQSRRDAKFPLVNLGEIISAVRRVVRKDDYDGQIPIVKKITFADGTLELRDKRKTGMDLLVVEKGELLVSKINFHQGAVALNTVGRITCSTHYQPYAIKSEIVLPEYLILALRSSAVISGLDAIKSGGIKTELTADQICDFKIPLPSLAEQKRILATYLAALERADTTSTHADQQQVEANRLLETDLGLKNEAAKPKFKPAKLYFFKFATLQRWGVTDESDRLRSTFPLVELGSLLELVQYGISEKATKEQTALPMIRMNNIGDGELDLSELKYVRGKPENYLDYFLRKGDILFNRTNSKELVGKTAVFMADGDYVFASYLIRLRLNAERAEAAFINYIFNSPFCRTQIDSKSRQALGQANINSKELRLFLFPLPPLVEQRRIVAKLDALRQASRYGHAEAEEIHSAAKSFFEQALFSKIL